MKNKHHGQKRRKHLRRVDIENMKKRSTRAFRGLAVVFVVLVCVLLVQTYSLNAQKQTYQAQYESLQDSYKQESEKSAELESQRTYVQTKQYLESVAREKLGLVNKDEILIKPKDE